MKLAFRTRLYVGFTLAILLCAASGITSYVILEKQKVQRTYVRQARSLLDTTNNIQKNLLDMETGSRGYRATNQKRFLEPYYNGLRHIRPAVDQLKNLLADDPAFSAKKELLDQRIDSLMRFWNNIGNGAVASDEASIIQLTDDEKSQMDSLRVMLASLQKDETKILNARREEYDQLVHYGTLASAIDSIISEVIIVILVIIVLREFRSRRKVQEQLRETVAQLKVQTAELQTSENGLKNAMGELGKINKQLEKFVYTVAHDVKSPLSGIIGAMSVLQADEAVNKDAELKEFIDLSSNAAMHLCDMVNSLLEYSRLSITQQPAEEVNTRELLSQMAKLLFPPKSIQIRIAADMPVLSTHKIKLEQVFQNLISNAIKYNGREKGLIEIGYKDKGAQYEFYVKDNGQGIAGDDKEAIFALLKTGGATSSVDSSTGFGLNIVKLIVEEQGGKIWYDSVVGEGATFFFEWSKR